MAKFKGDCGIPGEKVGATYNRPMKVIVDISNSGDCEVSVSLFDKDDERIKRKKIPPDPDKEWSVHGKDVVRVSIKCGGSKGDGDCNFEYSIDAE